jgi:hypothetical protein
MSYPEFMAARQLLAEERVGTRLRQQHGAEDSAFDQAVQAAKKVGT